MTAASGIEAGPSTGETLAEAIRATYLATRTPPPCYGRDEWTSDEPTTRLEAAEACTWCPPAILAACRAHAASTKSKFGVWGAADLDPTARPPRAKAKR